MNPSLKYFLLLTLSAAVYFIASKTIFDKVNETSKIVIDELFHIPQGLSCCNGNLSYYDPKITTLPGLYVFSAVVVGLYFPCNTYNLRFVNLIASCINLILFSYLLKFIYGSQNKSQFKIVVQALNLALLPPLYFFSHVYYSDTLSLMFLLMFSALSFINKSKWFIFLCGMYSVVVRQTNVAWIAMVLGHKMLDILIRSSRVFGNNYLRKTTLSKQSFIAHDVDASKLKRYYGISDVFVALKYHLSTGFTTVFQFITMPDVYCIIQQVLILASFASFLCYNGSVVVGDKDSHPIRLHLPQLLYFLLFYGVFGLPYVLNKLVSTIKIILRNKLNCLLLGGIFIGIVHFNTIAHPYLLSDNRHYTFYVWNRWFGKYDYAIYATIPVYIFLLFSLYDNLRDQNCISFLLPYCISLFLVVGLQQLVEVRYFLIPYIILRLRFVRPSFETVLLEFLWYVALNAVTFYIFFTKEIIWDDFSDVQRIIW